MKFLLVSLAIIAATSAQYNPQQQSSEPIPILRQEQDSNPDGTYSFSYEAGNSIQHEEVGRQGESNGEEGPAIIKEGRYSWSAPDGTPYSVSYTADESGFHPVGDHIPTPPPTPDAILRALEYIQSHPQPEQQQQQ